MTNSRPAQGGEWRRIDLAAVSKRLRALNPHLTSIEVEPATKPEAHLRVVIRTKEAELRHAGGRLVLKDPELEGLQLQTDITFLDHKPGDRRQVTITPTGSDGKPLLGNPRKLDA
jgi:hypothetical protein